MIHKIWLTICLHVIVINSTLLMSEPISDYSECGISDFEPDLDYVPKMDIDTNRVYKGKAVEDAKSLPWMTTLLSRAGAFCTATIIGPKHILTAYHCVKNEFIVASQIQISYGAVKVSRQVRKSAVHSIKMHPASLLAGIRLQLFFPFSPVINFRNEFASTDLAIIELKKRIKFSPNVRPICLFGIGTSYDQSDGTNRFDHLAKKTKNGSFVVAGWGLTQPSCMANISRTPSDQLMFGKMRMIATNKCRQLVQSEAPHFPIGPLTNITAAFINEFYAEALRSNICLVADPSNIQSGDSGGPLMSKMGTNNWVQVAVASSGVCDPESPTKTDGITSHYAPIDCGWVANATNGAVKCKGW